MSTPPAEPSVDTAAPRDGSQFRRVDSGTTVMLAGTVMSAIGSYLFQLLGSRGLGTNGFAPVAVIWTLFFLGFTVFLMPIEQLVIRRLALSGGDAAALRPSRLVIGLVIVGITVASVAFTWLARDRFFDGDGRFVAPVLVLFVGLGIYAVARGFLAGRRRFVHYGASISAHAVALVVLALIALAVMRTALGFSWALALAPFTILAVQPFQRHPTDGSLADEASDVAFLGAFLVATAASQTVLAAGPIVVGALGAPAARISVFFNTFTLFRGPMTASYNLIARVLPRFTRYAAEGRGRLLDLWAARIGGVGLALMAAGAAFGAGLGPAIVAALYGADFRPEPVLPALAAAGVVAGIVGLFVTQILVARGATGVLAAVWLVAVGAAAVTIVLAGGEPTIRVGWGFFVGEAVAMVGLVAAAFATSQRGYVAGTPALGG